MLASFQLEHDLDVAVEIKVTVSMAKLVWRRNAREGVGEMSQCSSAAKNGEALFSTTPAALPMNKNAAGVTHKTVLMPKQPICCPLNAHLLKSELKMHTQRHHHYRFAKSAKPL